jgi:Porin subfamily
MNRTSLTKNVLTASLLTLPFTLVAGDAPGVFKIPGTDSTMKIYGFAELNGVYDMGTHNSDIDDFDWASFLPVQPFDHPVPGVQSAATKNNSLYMTVRTSRFGITTTTPSDLGPITMKFEGDFNSPSPSNFSSPTTTNGNTFRVRQAWGQVGGFLFGQTWTTMFDGDSLPDTVDFNEVPSATLLRIPMLQYTFKTGSNSTLAIAAEFPFDRMFQGASGHVVAQDAGEGYAADSYQDIPDLHANWTYSDKWGHVSLRGVMLTYKTGGNEILSGSSTVTQPSVNATGYGAALSGHFNLAGDTLVWSVMGGNGIGRYLFGDILQSAINDGSKIDLWKGLGWHVGYTHNWDAKWRSNLIFSQVTNTDPGTAYGVSLNKWMQSTNIEASYPTNPNYWGADGQPNKTLTNALVNTFYQISKTYYCGVEYAWGTRKTFETYSSSGSLINDGSTGTQKRVNFVFHANFF